MSSGRLFLDRVARQGHNRMQHLARIGKAGADVLRPETGITVKDLLLYPASGHQIDDSLDGHPRALRDGLSGRDLRVNADAIVASHGRQGYQTVKAVSRKVPGPLLAGGELP